MAARCDPFEAALHRALREARALVRFLARNRSWLIPDLDSVAQVEVVDGYRRRWMPNKGDLWAFVRTRVQEAVRQEIREASSYVPTEMDAFEAPPVNIEARIDASRRRPSLHEVPVHAGGRVWTVGSLAAARGVSERYVRKLIAEGKLFARKTAAGYEIPDALALEFLARPKS